jgi:UDP-N-acetylmuramyl pentapeptide phosphotransferase/UDP-N-acetylglucosamine-1-phosphate transferase
MMRPLPGAFLALMPFSLHAQEPSQAPVEVSYLPMVVVILVLVGMVAGFFWYVGKKERERRHHGRDPG